MAAPAPKRWHLALVAAIAMISTAPSCATAADRRAMLERAVERWVQAQAPDGSLGYGFDFLSDRPAEPHDRPWAFVVRQAGWMYALADYYAWSRAARLREPTTRALDALRRQSIPLGKPRAADWLESTRILSLPFARWKLTRALDRTGLLYRTDGPGRIVSPDGRYETALTGATAVALLAELAYAQASGDNAYADLRAGWLTSLLTLRIPGRGFRDTPASIDESDFSNGEVWLALALYADRFRDDTRVTEVLRDVDTTFMERYTRAPTIAFHHWGAMAAAQRWRTTRDARFLDYLERQGDILMDGYVPRMRAGANNCTEIEGSAALVGTLEQAGRGGGATAQRVRRWLEDEEAVVPSLQIQPGQASLSLGGDAALRAPRLAQFAGAFLMGRYDPSTRVDADMHCVFALLLLERNAERALK